MRNEQVKQLALAGLLVALGVLGGTLSVPVGASKCCPMQSIVNILSAVFLGPWYALGNAFCISLLRNLLGTGTLLAFPGSMVGAFLAGWLYRKKPHLALACLGEAVGTGLLAAVLAWPLAVFVLGKAAGPLTYVLPFTLAAVVGVALATVLVVVMARSGALRAMGRLAAGK